MGVFATTEEMYRVMDELFRRIAADGELAARLAEGEMVLHLVWRDPDGEATIDLRQQPIGWTMGPSDLTPDVEMTQSADISHRFWLGRLSVPQAIATRKVVTRGSVPKALKLLPAIQPAFAVYQRTLEELGHADLVPPPTVRRQRRGRLGRWWRGLRARRVGEVDRQPPIPLLDAPEDSVHLEIAAPATSTDTAERACELLRRMLLVREFELHLSRAYAAGELPTEAIHLSIGQEATAVGACAALCPADTIVTTHRGHGHMLARGADPQAMMDELYGKASGLCGGKGGSMHVTDARIGALGANGIVGASPLIATGAALAAAQTGSGSVSVAFLGDGATNQGMSHEAFNFAAVFSLPAVFVIENNLYGEFTPLGQHCRVERLADRAAAYGMPGVQVDGNDVEAVRLAVGEAADRARSGDGPSLVECLTYRWHGHMEGETTSYRSSDEVAEWRQRDPVERWARHVVAEDIVTLDDLQGMRHDAVRAVEEMAERAIAAADPSFDAVETDVFSPESPDLYVLGSDVAPCSGREISYSAGLREALVGEMERDQSVFLLGEDVSHGGYFAVTAGLGDEFPSRVLDTPISEYAIVGSAVGAAMCGQRPIAEILFADFLTTCMDPLVNQAAKLRYMSGGQYALPMVVRCPGGAGLGMAAQHSQSFETLLAGIPGLIVVAPATPADAKGLLTAAIRSSNPVLVIENKLLYLEIGPVPVGEYVVPLGRAAVRRVGGDVTLVAVGGMVPTALRAAEGLATEGVDVEVVDVRTVWPLDAATIVESVARTRHLVTVEEAPRSYGFGAEVAARVAESLPPSTLRAPIRRVASLAVPIPYARILEHAAIPNIQRIRDAVLETVG